MLGKQVEINTLLPVNTEPEKLSFAKETAFGLSWVPWSFVVE